MSDRIDHAAEARRLVELSDSYLRRQDGERMSEGQAVVSQMAAINGNLGALVNSQLALVEQQRIANLIALAESGRTTVNGARQALSGLYSGSAEEGSAHMALRPEIREALGIRE